MNDTRRDSDRILGQAVVLGGNVLNLPFYFPTGAQDRVSHKHSGSACGCLQIKGNSGCISHGYDDLLDRYAELFRRNLGKHCTGTLSHVGGTGKNGRATVHVQTHDRIGGRRSGAHFHSHGNAATAAFAQGFAPADCIHSFLERFSPVSVRRRIIRYEYLTSLGEILHTNGHPVEPKFLCCRVKLGLNSPIRLGNTEPPECRTGSGVGQDSAGYYAYVRHPVRTGRDIAGLAYNAGGNVYVCTYQVIGLNVLKNKGSI